MLFLAFSIVAKILYIQYGQDRYWKKMGKKVSEVKKHIIAERGNIYTEDGRILATTLPTFKAIFDPNAKGLVDSIWNKKIDTLCICLNHLIPTKSSQKWKEELVFCRKKNKKYFVLANKLTFQQYKTLKTFPIFNINKKNVSGLIIETNNTRKLPFKGLAMRTIGYVRDSNRIKRGIEGKFNEQLEGENKEVLMVKVAKDVYMPKHEVSNFGSKPGLDIYTTIDINLQDIAQEALKETLIKNKAKHGSVILMNVKTGAIKAIANMGLDKINNTYQEDYNYAIAESNEPGSVIKLASVMALIDEGYCDENEMVYLNNGRKKFYDKYIIDDAPRNSTVTLSDAFAVSSNVGITTLVDKYFRKNKNKYYQKLEQFQLTNKTGIELQGEPEPYIKNPKEWTGVSMLWMAIGYELKLTPIQILRFYSAVANNGKMMKPYIVKSIKENYKIVEQFEPEVVNEQIAKPSTIAKVKKMLNNVVDAGTAKNIKSMYGIAGKTGTNLIATKHKGYKNAMYQASFVGYFPSTNPTYACIVVVNGLNKKNEIHGSAVAAPVFKKMADRIYSSDIQVHPDIKTITTNKLSFNSFKSFTKDIKTVLEALNIDFLKNDSISEFSSAIKVKNKLIVKPMYFSKKLMPNLKNMNLKDAIYFLEIMGLNVSIEGKGKIKEQSIKPGQRIVKGNYIKLTLG